MRSALVFTPHGFSSMRYVAAFCELITAVEELTNTLNKDSEVLLQHDLKGDRFAVTIETSSLGSEVFTGVGPTFDAAIRNVILDIRIFKEAHVAKLLTDKKQAAGEKSRKGPRRQRPKGKRVKRLRKG